MAERAEFRISDLAGLFDGPHATPKRIKEGAHFLNIASLSNGRLDLTESDHVSDEDFRRWTKRVVPQSGDLLFSYETRLGEAALMPSGVRACLGRRMALLRPDPDVIDPRFLLYLYLSPTFKRLIEKNTIHGATVNRIALSTMPEWTVQLPSLTEQRAIAEVLGALDDKIAANTRLTATASKLAESLTHEGVEPGRKMALKHVAEVVMGSSPVGASLNENGSGTVFYQGVKDFGFRFPRRRIWTEQITRLGEAGDTLLSVRAPVGRVNVASEPICIGRGLAAIRTTVGTPATLFNLLKAFPEVWDPFEAEGTIFGSINRGQLQGLQVPSVKSELAAGLESRLAELEALIKSVLAENDLLAELRDSLLPELTSGRLCVKDAAKQIEEVV